jgi:hypothetical protein
VTTKQNQNKQTTKGKGPKQAEFFLHELREHSKQLFGVKPEVVDGAFLNVKEQKITKEHAQKLITDFLKKEVK